MRQDETRISRISTNGSYRFPFVLIREIGVLPIGI